MQHVISMALFCSTAASCINPVMTNKYVYPGVSRAGLTPNNPYIYVKSEDPEIQKHIIWATEYWAQECGVRKFLPAAFKADVSPVIIVIFDDKITSLGQIVDASDTVHVMRLKSWLRDHTIAFQSIMRHELGHALGGGGHIPGDPLMRPVLTLDGDLFPNYLNLKNRERYCK